MQSWPAVDVPDLPGQGPTVHLFDTASGTVLPTRAQDPTTLYVCGITPYDATHLGHASTYLAFDLLVRAWRDDGRTVRYVQNVTDVDDPLLERADATGQDWRHLAMDQTELFRGDMTVLRILPPEHYVGAVESIGIVVDAVEKLLADGHAYHVPLPAGAGGDRPDLGDVYADITTDPTFGDHAGLDDAAMVGVFAENGGDPDRAGKRHPLDPLLWRRTREGEPDWDGRTLGRGRPGWHIECASIGCTYLGPDIEVQGGGSDLVFPHHEMSESHLRTLTGHAEPVRLHVHSGMVGYRGAKMSKSLGNLVFVSRLLDGGADPMAVRLVLLAHHYRADWEYDDAQLAAATDRLAHWRDAVALPAGPEGGSVLDGVRAALADDLDAPRALAVVDAWADAATGGAMADGAAVGAAEAPELVRRTVDALLGVAL